MFVLDLEEPLDEAPAIDNYSLRLDDPLTLVTAINKDSSINNLFNELNKLNIKVKSMRNESNRLEELIAKNNSDYKKIAIELGKNSEKQIGRASCRERV